MFTQLHSVDVDWIKWVNVTDIRDFNDCWDLNNMHYIIVYYHIIIINYVETRFTSTASILNPANYFYILTIY